MTRIGVYAGSFDPVTVGHADVIARAAALVDELRVTVMFNIAKKGCFSVEERLALLRKATKDIPNVVVDAWDGLLVDYARQAGAQCIIRGLRGVADFESEKHLAQINSLLLPGIETVFLMTKPEYACISSSAVREAAHFGAELSAFVPGSILGDVRAHFKKG